MNESSSSHLEGVGNAISGIITAVGNKIQFLLAIFVVLAVYLYAQKDVIGIAAHYLIIALAFFMVYIVGVQHRSKIHRIESELRSRESLLDLREKHILEQEKALKYMRKLEEAYKKEFRNMTSKK